MAQTGKNILGKSGLITAIIVIVFGLCIFFTVIIRVLLMPAPPIAAGAIFFFLIAIFLVIQVAKEYVVVQGDEKNISIRRPLLQFLKIKKNEALVTISLTQLKEVQNFKSNAGYLSSWRFISDRGELLARFTPGYFLGMKLRAYLDANNIPFRKFG